MLSHVQALQHCLAGTLLPDYQQGCAHLHEALGEVLLHAISSCALRDNSLPKQPAAGVQKLSNRCGI